MVIFFLQTGVYNENEKHVLEHSPRDFLPVEAKLQEPSITVGCVYEAIDTIFRRENFSWSVRVLGYEWCFIRKL